MVKYSHCNRKIDEKAALVHKDASGSRRVICTDCFEKLAGVDYKTFAYRKESAKQMAFAMICCIAATIYAFLERGWEYGVIGIVVTILLYFFAGELRK